MPNRSKLRNAFFVLQLVVSGGACTRPAPVGKPVSLWLTPDGERRLNLFADGGAPPTVYGAVFLPEGEDAVSAFSLCLDSALQFQVALISIVGPETHHARPPPVGSYPFGGNSPLPIEHASYLQAKRLDGTLVGFDGGTVLTAATNARFQGRFDFAEDVRPVVACTTCPDGLYHYGLSAEFEVPAYPGNQMPYRGAPPVGSNDGDE